MTVSLVVASDHGGFELKEKLKAVLDRLGVAYRDEGTHSAEAVDYPDYARLVARAVSRGEAKRGLLVCGSGQGMAMAANRHPHVRAAVAWSPEVAALTRKHNDANVLALGGRVLDHDRAARILEVWLATAFAGGRHLARVEKIDRA